MPAGWQVCEVQGIQMPSQPKPYNHKPNSRQAGRLLNTNSKEWKRIRETILVRDSYQCQGCGKVVLGRQAHVDHKDNDSRNNDPCNLQTLCMQGHSRKTFAEQQGKQWDGKCTQRRIGLDGWPVDG